MQQRFPEEKDLTLEKCVSMCWSIEKTTRQVQEMKDNSDRRSGSAASVFLLRMRDRTGKVLGHQKGEDHPRNVVKITLVVRAQHMERHAEHAAERTTLQSTAEADTRVDYAEHVRFINCKRTKLQRAMKRRW